MPQPEENAVKPNVIRCALFAFVAVVTGQAQAQTWPDKPITFIVPFAAGGTADVVAPELPGPTFAGGAER